MSDRKNKWSINYQDSLFQEHGSGRRDSVDSDKIQFENDISRIQISNNI